MKFNTKATHGNIQTHTGAVMPPYIKQRLMHKQALDILWEYEYSTKPTRTALENALASIENGKKDWPFHLG
jgi:cystathionine beta-lyase